MNHQKKKVVVWFSCGATSAVAAKMAIKNLPEEEYDLRVVYCDTHSEHEDNYRFMGEVGAWIGRQPEILCAEDYRDIWDVFENTKVLVMNHGYARCTDHLKKKVRQRIEREWWPDFQVFGFDAGEQLRADRFRNNNPEVRLITPLLKGGGFDWCQDVDKATCLGMLVEAGIEVPAMYRLGFNNANCIGCPKGGGAYWNKIRKVFPEIFARMAKMERNLDVAINKTYAGDGERKRLFLDEMPEDFGRDEPDIPIQCDLLCGMMYDDVIGGE